MNDEAWRRLLPLVAAVLMALPNAMIIRIGEHEFWLADSVTSIRNIRIVWDEHTQSIRIEGTCDTCDESRRAD